MGDINPLELGLGFFGFFSGLPITILLSEGSNKTSILAWIISWLLVIIGLIGLSVFLYLYSSKDIIEPRLSAYLLGWLIYIGILGGGSMLTGLG